MRKTFISIYVALLFISLANALDIKLLAPQWTEFKLKHAKIYKSKAEEQVRFQIWRSNLEFVERHNREANATYTLKINKYGDLTVKEFERLLQGFDKDLFLNKTSGLNQQMFRPSPSLKAAPPVLNWIDAAGPVKDQGSCGSCWAFSATGAIESKVFLTTGRRVVLSEQQLIDCSTPYGNFGCDGGLMNNAFKYIINEGGITNLKNYPYKGKNGECRFKPSASDPSLIKLKGILNCPRNEKIIEQAVAEKGPFTHAINAGRNTFMFYHQGIYSDPNCRNGDNDLNHAMLIVGYNNNERSWLLKNSWGTGWGDRGYMRIAKGRNQCGIANFVSQGILA